MTRSGIWIGAISFVLAMMGTVSIDSSDRDTGLSSIALGGSAAFAQIQLPDIVEGLEITVGGDEGDDPDDDDDDDTPDNSDDDDR